MKIFPAHFRKTAALKLTRTLGLFRKFFNFFKNGEMSIGMKCTGLSTAELEWF